jgi:hypothetical protein
MTKHKLRKLVLMIPYSILELHKSFYGSEARKSDATEAHILLDNMFPYHKWRKVKEVPVQYIRYWYGICLH